MEWWNDKYGRVPIGACADDAREIALGVSSVGVAVGLRIRGWDTRSSPT